MNPTMSEIPSCLADAYDYLADGRAWVVCMPVHQGVATLASKAKTTDFLYTPAEAFARPECPKETRAAFLLGGIKQLEKEVLWS